MTESPDWKRLKTVEVSDALVVSEGVPPWLRSLLDRCQSPGEVLFAGLIVLVHEFGFVREGQTPSRLPTFDIAQMRQLTSDGLYKKENGSFRIDLTLKGAEKTTTLLLVPVQRVVIVNFIVDTNVVASLTFEVEKYVDFDSRSLINGKELSIKFHEGVAAVKSCLLPDLSNPTHILHLPVELLSTISQFLPPKDFMRFCFTCKRLYSLSDEESIWRVIARMYFPARNLRREPSKSFVIFQYKKSLDERSLQSISRGYFVCPTLYYTGFDLWDGPLYA